MPDDTSKSGWAWFEEPVAAGDDDPDELARHFARCFAGADGDRVLDHLRRAFLDRRLPPAASNAELRHLEGQRSVVAQLIALVERGRG